MPKPNILIVVFAVLMLARIQLASAQLKATLEGHTDIVSSVAFRPNGVMLASVSWDQTVRLWNVKTERLLHTLRGHTAEVASVAFSPDGQTLASASWDATIRLWSPNTGKLKRTLPGHTGGVTSVAFSPDGQTLASGSANSTIQLWNAKTWKPKITLRGHTHVVDIIAFSPDGDMLASGSRDTTIRLWNPNTGKHIKTLVGHTSDVSRMMFSPDGQTLASGSRDETVRLWNPNNEHPITTLTNQYGWAKPVAFSPDGVNLLIGSYNHISVWDTETGEFKKALATDAGNTTSVVFSPDGQRVASGSADNKVRLWKYNPSDLEFPTIDTNGMVRLIYFLPNDRPARPERVSALRQLIKDVQQFYADQMERHGFGRKTFTVETDKNGEPVVHHIDGKFPEAHYYKPGFGHKIWVEVREHFNDNDLQHIPFVAIDFSGEGGEGTINFYSQDGQRVRWMQPNLTKREEAYGGFAAIPASGDLSENIGFPAHELGHAFGLLHDYRQGHEDTLMGGSRERFSKCTAEWLSVHHFFNTQPIARNMPAEIQLLSVRAYSRQTISLRFNVTDPDGLHQAQLLLPELNPDGGVSGPRTMFDCKPLNGKTSTFESTVRTAALIDRATLQIIDVKGNITWATFPIELDAVVSDQNILDIDSNGVVNISDLTHIASRLGQRGNNPADVNADSVVETADLLLVAASLSSLSRQEVETLVATDVEKWLADAKQLRIENEFQQKGIVFLEHLLAEIVLSSKPPKVVTAPLKAIFEGHTDLVKSLAFSPDGQTLASASQDRAIRLSDPHTAQLKILLMGHTAPVNSIAFSLDGRTLASVGRDATIRLWNPLTGQPKTTLRAHTGFSYMRFYSVAFSPDSQTLAAGGNYENPDIRLWNLDNLENVRTLTGHENRISSIAFSPNGQTLASGSWDETVRLWNANTGDHLRTLTGHTAEVKSVIFSPDGQILASASQDGSIRLWNPRNGEETGILTGNTDWIEQIAFSPDGEILASGSQNRRIRFWNTKQPQYQEALEENAPSVISVAFSPDGTTLASSRADKTIQLWDVQTLLEQSPTFEIGPNKITGPWLWMIAPTQPRHGGARSNDVDSLSEASQGRITEADVAANGAREGDSVGNYVWTLGEISPTGGDNVNALVNKIGMAEGDVDDHSSYALITLESATAQSDVTMHAGSDDSIKIWLNGEVVHNNPINRGAQDYKDTFKVDLKQGDNLLLVKVSERDGGWSMFVGIDADVDTKRQFRAAPLLQALQMPPPTETVLFSNYPNPFNPETWIPYQLSDPAEVTVHIYAVDGRLIRRLALGHQPVGHYTGKSRAAYWDGRNQLGERVASGLYFYTLTAGDFTATRKMLIRK